MADNETERIAEAVELAVEKIMEWRFKEMTPPTENEMEALDKRIAKVVNKAIDNTTATEPFKW